MPSKSCMRTVMTTLALPVITFASFLRRHNFHKIPATFTGIMLLFEGPAAFSEKCNLIEQNWNLIFLHPCLAMKHVAKLWVSMLLIWNQRKINCGTFLGHQIGRGTLNCKISLRMLFAPLVTDWQWILIYENLMEIDRLIEAWNEAEQEIKYSIKKHWGIPWPLMGGDHNCSSPRKMHQSWI